jgi:hypothetical protein
MNQIFPIVTEIEFGNFIVSFDSNRIIFNKGKVYMQQKERFIAILFASLLSQFYIKHLKSIKRKYNIKHKYSKYAFEQSLLCLAPIFSKFKTGLLFK